MHPADIDLASLQSALARRIAGVAHEGVRIMVGLFLDPAKAPGRGQAVVTDR